VIGLLEQHFERLVDYDFTAAMEDELERIAAGDQRRTAWLTGFYFGGEIGVEARRRGGGLKKLIDASVEASTRARSTPSRCSTTRRPHRCRPRRPLRAVPGA